ncbi:hypothetical protein F0562_035795 [Nyssa sinensis]|uniref:Retrotransposon gag domain-containing protein n=1 Tax=Nyssa sinensis TaxID=561372 RepID=A0A5J5ACT9_9ASTE|nr:hypothetical protein F0562_035795 [Nyssa sinensis]
MSNNKVHLQGNVPFSWENKPGVSKITCHDCPADEGHFKVKVLPPPPCPPENIAAKASYHDLQIPLPPCPFQPPSRSSSRRGIRKEDDPFLTAYKECTKSTRKGGISSWERFVRALQIRFGSSPHEDPMKALIRLKQTSIVEDYKSQFEALSNQLRGLAKSYKLSCFLSGLRKDIRFMRRTAKLGFVPTRLAIRPLSPHEKRAIVLVQRLSPSQMKEQRDKGLCYNCDDKWAPEHKCKSTRLFIMECDESSDDEMPKSEVTEGSAGKSKEETPIVELEPEISIHALFGSPNPKQ